MRAGGADYLLKPFDSAQINACLQKLGLLTEKQEHRRSARKSVLRAVFGLARQSLHAGHFARGGGGSDGHELVLLLALFSARPTTAPSSNI